MLVSDLLLIEIILFGDGEESAAGASGLLHKYSFMLSCCTS